MWASGGGRGKWGCTAVPRVSASRSTTAASGAHQGNGRLTGHTLAHTGRARARKKCVAADTTAVHSEFRGSRRRRGGMQAETRSKLPTAGNPA